MFFILFKTYPLKLLLQAEHNKKMTQYFTPNRNKLSYSQLKQFYAISQIQNGLQIMNFEKQQKGLFTFYLEQAQDQLIANNARNSFETSKKLNQRTQRSSQDTTIPNIAMEIMKTFEKYKMRNKMYCYFENTNQSELSDKRMSQQQKQKNISSVIGKNESAKTNFKYKKFTQQLSSIQNFRAQLEQLETKKRIVTQESILNQQLNILSMKKKYSEQDLRKTKLNYQYPTIKLEYQIQKECDVDQKHSFNRELHKKTFLANKSKGCLKPKIRHIQKQNLALRFKQLKENKQLLRFSQETQTEKLYKRFKRVNNPLKKCNEPFLQPIKSHRIRQFKEYYVKFQKQSRQLQGDRNQIKEKYSQNYRTFAEQKQVDCLHLLKELKQIKY